MQHSFLIIRFVTVLLLCLGLNLSGCAPKKIIVPPVTFQPVRPAAEPVRPVSLLGEAESAWNAGNMSEAERLYGAVLQESRLTLAQRETAYARLAGAALANSHPAVALGAVQRWKEANPAVTGTADWLRLWGQTVMGLPEFEAQSLAQAVLDDSSESVAFRAQAGGVLMLLAQGDARLPFAQNLTSLYNGAGNQDKAVMERGLIQIAGLLKSDALDDMLQYTLPDTDRSFPWSVLLLEKARREATAMQGAGQEGATSSALERVSGDGVFADASLVRETLSARSARTFVPIVSRVPLHAGCYALALPMSGSFAGVGQRVAAGAKAAQDELNRGNVRTELQIIDTDSSQWLDQLAALPPQCVTVGGPLLPALYRQAKERQLLSQRAFFTFLSTLDGSDEGSLAWRFFSSPADQVNAMTRFAQQAGVTRFATLYPAESYGERMSGLFTQTAPAGSVISSAAYQPKEVTSWNGVTARFVGGYKVGKIPASSATFQAVFLPDSWNNAALLIPYIFFNGEDRLLLMGTVLWEQGMSSGRKIDPSNMKLAVFPGAWNRSEPSPAAQNLAALLASSGAGEVDVWSGLGYDFVRFAAALNLQAGWSAGIVNGALDSASQINWSMAPISWSGAGMASQNLYVFSPADGTPHSISPEEMRSRLEQARSRYDRRMGTARAAQKKGEK